VIRKLPTYTLKAIPLAFLFLFLLFFFGERFVFRGPKRKYFSFHHPPIALSAAGLFFLFFWQALPGSLILIDDADCRE